MSDRYGIDDARDALHHCDPAQDRRQWVRLLAAAKDAGLSFDDVLTWSASAANFSSERDVMTAWRGLRADGGIRAGTLFHAARAAGWRPGAGQARPARPAPVVRVVKPEPERQHHEALSPFGLRLWASSLPLAGTIGAAYLLARGCALPPPDGDLRFLPAHKHPHGDYTGPALLALVTDALTGAPISLHQTFIKPDGTKPENLPGPARLLLGGHRKAGGCIRLWPDEAVTTGLGVGEGIESCLSLAHAITPVWSLIDAGNLSALPVLAGIEHLVIAADADPAGMRAAGACAARWSEAGIPSSIVVAGCIGRDLNDIIKDTKE